MMKIKRTRSSSRDEDMDKNKKNPEDSKSDGKDAKYEVEKSDGRTLRRKREPTIVVDDKKKEKINKTPTFPEKEKHMDEARRLGYRLRTLLRLPKAHKWACYEWFYANIDRTLLAGENDFCACLKETFPSLANKKLTRTEWCKVRRLMGKPRRCSQAFLAQERALLNLKRQKIRQLQQQKVVDVNYYRDLPEQIPLSLVIGTRVTALLHKPHDGLCTGIIDAVDTANHGYRITFDKSEIGTHTVPDYEVLSNDPPEFLPLNSFQTRIKPRMPILKSPKFLEILGNQVAEALGGRTDNSTLIQQTDNDDQSVSQYPMKLLALMVRVSKILALKKKRIFELKSMNDEVERLHSLNQEVPIELKRSYASNILDFEKLNSDLDDHLNAIHLFSGEFSIDTSCIPNPDTIKQKCQTDAKVTLDLMLKDHKVSNAKSLDMLNHMATLVYLLKSASESEDNALQLKALDDTMHEYKSKLSRDFISSYEDNIEIHVNYIKNIAGCSRG